MIVDTRDRTRRPVALIFLLIQILCLDSYN